MSIKERLQEIATNNPNSIQEEVAQEALEYDNPNEFFQQLQQHGCVSGMVTKLIYYKDTHEFYDKYYDEIEELRQEYLENGLLTKQPEGDLKNFYSWFAFEETARKVYDILN